MSSTGRKPAQGTLTDVLSRARHPDDFYATPSWVVDVLIDREGKLPGTILDPGCGDGALLAALRDRGMDTLVGVELDPGRAKWAAITGADIHCQDFLTEPVPAFTSIVSNPPYSLAEEFVRRSLEHQAAPAPCYFLLRLAFLAGQKRAKGDLWDYLAAVYVLPRRPSFTGKGTDSTDYAWFKFWRGSEFSGNGATFVNSSLGSPRRSRTHRLEHLGDGRD